MRTIIVGTAACIVILKVAREIDDLLVIDEGSVRLWRYRKEGEYLVMRRRMDDRRLARKMEREFRRELDNYAETGKVPFAYRFPAPREPGGASIDF